MGYPSVDLPALARFTASESALAAVTLMVDDVRQLDLVDSVRASGAPVRVAVDVDAGLRIGPGHVGPRRSPLFDTADVVELAEEIGRRDGFRMVGVMTYEGQVAGVPDDVPRHRVRSAAVRSLKGRSVAQLQDRRAGIASALHELVELEFWNAGGSGSVESSVADPAVTEVTAGSGLLVPGLFDHYRSFAPLPAAYFGLGWSGGRPRRSRRWRAAAWSPPGPPARTAPPSPGPRPGLHLTTLEGAGEVQTPLSGPGASALLVGELVWFRHAKSGEVAEHVLEAHLLVGSAIVDTVPTYRGTGNAW